MNIRVLAPLTIAGAALTKEQGRHKPESKSDVMSEAALVFIADRRHDDVTPSAAAKATALGDTNSGSKSDSMGNTNSGSNTDSIHTMHTTLLPL